MLVFLVSFIAFTALGWISAYSVTREVVYKKSGWKRTPEICGISAGVLAFIFATFNAFTIATDMLGFFAGMWIEDWRLNRLGKVEI